ncbi:hypothetical protein [Azohydromonas sp.]|uniref:hypothetical protein n=1 Tax=Azohydromonas sp. TaxID=1872666 RepID=UPI002B5E19BE|nr:hypothetical protein [Azohydromonas sp.]HMM84542.1 hypothetical protein [Azohydromonas sp.]
MPLARRHAGDDTALIEVVDRPPESAMNAATRLSLMPAVLAVVAAAAWVVDAGSAPAVERPPADGAVNRVVVTAPRLPADAGVHRVVVTAPRAVADEAVVHRVEITATRLHPEATLTADAVSPQPRAL